MSEDFYERVAKRRWPNLDAVAVKNTAGLVKDILTDGGRYVASDTLREEVILAAKDQKEEDARNITGDDQDAFWTEFRRLHKLPKVSG